MDELLVLNIDVEQRKKDNRKHRGTKKKSKTKTALKLGHYFGGFKKVASLPRRLRLFAESRKRHGSETTIFKA